MAENPIMLQKSRGNTQCLFTCSVVKGLKLSATDQ